MAKICLLKKIQIKTNPDNATYNTLKYKVVLKSDAVSNIIILSATQLCASVLPYLGIILSAFSFFKKVRAVAV